MRYCRDCILPDTRPNLRLDENGTCNACRNHLRKQTMDWGARECAFQNVVERAKHQSHGYDCVIPVSGGKDSTWQVVTCLQYGLNPLAVTWKTPGRTELGRRNLQNLIDLGVDHIDYQISPAVERQFVRRALCERGAPAIPMHMALFSIPLTIAVRFDIPLVVWGENSAFEYGSSQAEHEGFELNAEWLRTYGVTDGTTARDWIGDGLTERQLTAYRGPEPSELERRGTRAVFLGYYFRWDPQHTADVAQAHGFQCREAGPRTGFWNYADIDDDFISIHHWLKWYKFGFTRLFDNLSVEIRNGRLTRSQAVEIVRAAGDQCPRGDIERLCRFLGMSTHEFFNSVERFRNANIWQRRHGAWMIDDFLIPEWKWT